MEISYFTKPHRQSGGSPPLLLAIAAQPAEIATVAVSLMREVGMSHPEKGNGNLIPPGAPSFAFFAKGGIPRISIPTVAYPTLCEKRKGWGTL